MPEGVAEILAHTLARDPEERFATAAAMRRALENAMTKLDSESTSEDVADFIKQTLPELAEKRRETVAKAIEDAELRESGGAPSTSHTQTSQAVEAAFAPTVIEDVKSAGKQPAKLLTTKELFEQEAESKITPAGLETSATKRAGKGFVWILALGGLAAGAWFVWPGALRIRALASSSPPQTPTPEPSASAITSATASTSALPSASAQLVASASATPSASVGSLAPRPTPVIKSAATPSASVSTTIVIAAPSATEAPTDDPY